MRLNDRKWECTHCGALLDVPGDAVPYVMLGGASDEPMYRVLISGGEEVHQCPAPAHDSEQEEAS